MNITQRRRVLGFGLLLTALAVWPTGSAFAQFGGFGGGGFGGGGFGGGGFGGGGFGGGQNAGVEVDADGVLRMKVVKDPRGRLLREKFQAARRALKPEVTKPSMLRKISLNRLERAIAKRLANGEAPTEEMNYLAGLLRVQYVFFYPETNDIVIAGPAEGFAPDLTGRVRGLTSGRAVIALEDLIVALRAFPPAGNPTQLVGCSIDPTPEGLQRFQKFLNSVGSRITPAQTANLVRTMKQMLGPHVVTVQGVSPKTHFAQVLVEADYRMKLIGIGLEQPPVKMKSYVDRASGGGLNAMTRWWFVPNYEAVRVSRDETAMELVGWGVKLVGEEERVTADGQIRAARRGNRASQAWCAEFTKLYPKIADREPVFAQLRNLIDLAVTAAFIQQQDFYSQAHWDLGVFRDERRLPVETYEAPRQVEAAVNAIWRGNKLMTPIGGGVEMEPLKALRSTNRLPDEKGEVAKARQETRIPRLDPDQWWWD